MSARAVPCPPAPPGVQLPLLVPERPPLRALAAEADGLDCRVFVTFVQLLVGVALPALMVAHLQAPLHAAAAAAVEQQRRARRRAALRSAASLDSQDSQQSSEGSEGSEVRSPRTCGWNSRLSGTWAALGEAAHELEGFIQHLCAMLAGSTRLTPNSWVLTASAWWLLLSLTWVLALMLEQPVGGAAGAGAAALT